MSDVHSIEDALRRACFTLASSWGLMLPNGPRTQTAGIIGRSGERIDPVSPYLLGLRRVIAEQLAGWVLVIAEERDLRPTWRCPSWRWSLRKGGSARLCACGEAPGHPLVEGRHRLSALDVVRMARFVDTHAEWLAAHEAGQDAADELTASAEKVSSVIEPPGAREFVGRCSVCQGDLRARDGAAALCRECGTIVDTATYRDQAVRQAEDRLMTAAEIVRLAPRMWDHPVTHVHLSRWATRREIVPHAHTFGPDPRPMYRVGDVRDLVTRHAERRGA